MKTTSCKLLITLALCLTTLLTLASCGGVLIEVQFIVDGEVYETVTTTGKDTVRIPQSPTKEGYEFKGWYWDLDKWEEPFTANSLLEVPITDNMRVYARFVKIGENPNDQNPDDTNPDNPNPDNPPASLTLDAVKPEVGKAYHLAMLQTKLNVISYANGETSTYYLAGVTDITKAVNVYVENSEAESGKYYIFCVVNGERQYINLIRSGNFNNAVYGAEPTTSYRYDETLKTMVGTLNGAELVIGTNSEKEFYTFGTRYLDEPNCVAQFVLAKDQSAVIPPADEPELRPSSISEVINGTVGNTYKAEGVVVNFNAQSFLLQDESGMILVYKGSSWTPDVEIGDKLSVTGPLATYGGAMQFGTATEYTSLGREYVEHPEPIWLEGGAIDAYSELDLITPEFVTVQGVLSISGNYYNLEFEGTELLGSITYPEPEIAAVLSAFNGVKLEITGYVTGITGNGTFLNIMAYDISLAEEPDIPDPNYITIDEVLGNELGFYYSGGYVIGVNAQSFLLYDGTAIILVYKGEGWECDLSVGDMVLVGGTTTQYGKAVQFGTDTEYEKVSSSTQITYPTPEELTPEELNVYMSAGSISPRYVKIVGKLNISNAKYYNITIDGATVQGSISYPNTWDATVLTALNGKTIEVVGYITGVTGNSNQYLNIMAISFEEATVVPDAPFTGSILDAKQLADGRQVTLSGVVLSIDTAWSDDSGNMTVTITDGEDSIKIYQTVTQLSLGDVITVTGTIGTYAGNRQILAGAVAEITDHTDPIPPVEMSIAEALITIDGFPVIVTGTVTEVNGAWNATYGNMNVTITDESGNSLYLYRLSTQVSYGDVITVTGNMATFNGARQIAQGATAVIVEEDEPDDPNALELSSLYDVRFGTLGETYKAEGVVVGVNAQSFLLKDTSGMMLVYKGSSWAPDVAIGDKLTVTGPLATYGNAMQFGADTVYEKNGTEAVTQPTPEELDAAGVDRFAFENPILPTYVTVTGVLNIDGNYYNLTIDGATLIGSINYPLPEDAEALAALDGEAITVTGYVTGVASGRYLSILAISITVAE